MGFKWHLVYTQPPNVFLDVSDWTSDIVSYSVISKLLKTSRSTEWIFEIIFLQVWNYAFCQPMIQISLTSIY